MEPKAINSLVKEAEHLRVKARESISSGLSGELEHLFDEKTSFFDEEVLAKWRVQERYDELIDYILYQYAESGGEQLWKQVLLDLRLKKDDKKCFRMLDGLLVGRLDLLKVIQKSGKKFPENYLVSAEIAIRRGEVMKILYEYGYIVENRSSDAVDKALSKKIKAKVNKLLAS